jgi:hypothetical protein
MRRPARCSPMQPRPVTPPPMVSGANGLYTENMLKEMQAPAARIEDIFKRVRLNVRLQSRASRSRGRAPRRAGFLFPAAEGREEPLADGDRAQFQEELRCGTASTRRKSRLPSKTICGVIQAANSPS